MLGGLRKGSFGWVSSVCKSVGEGIGVTVKRAIANEKFIGSTLKVPLIMICFSNGYLWRLKCARPGGTMRHSYSIKLGAWRPIDLMHALQEQSTAEIFLFDVAANSVP